MAELPNQTPPASDETKNMKAEMDRKLSNLQTDMKKSSDALAAQLAALTAQLTPQPKVKTKSEEHKELEEELWENPAAFKERMKREAEQIADSKLNSYLENQQKATQQLSELYTAYPELQQQGHPMATRSVEIFNSLTTQEKASANAFKMAVAQAASENGIKPLSKRDESEMDDFSLKASGKQRKAAPKIDKNTETFAQVMGIDLTNEKTKKELEKYASLTSAQWGQWK